MIRNAEKINLPIVVLLLSIINLSLAQDAFSIVAVDPPNGEVGSTGTSCVDLSNFGTNDAETNPDFTAGIFNGIVSRLNASCYKNKSTFCLYHFPIYFVEKPHRSPGYVYVFRFVYRKMVLT